MERDVIFAHGKTVEVLEALTKFVSVAISGNEAEGLFREYRFVDRQPHFLFSGLAHALLESKPVAVEPFPRLVG